VQSLGQRGVLNQRSSLVHSALGLCAIKGELMTHKGRPQRKTQ